MFPLMWTTYPANHSYPHSPGAPTASGNISELLPGPELSTTKTRPPLKMPSLLSLSHPLSDMFSLGSDPYPLPHNHTVKHPPPSLEDTLSLLQKDTVPPPTEFPYHIHYKPFAWMLFSTIPLSLI